MRTIGRSSGFVLMGMVVLALACGKKDSHQRPGENAGSALNIIDGFEVNCARTRGPDLRRQIVYGPRIQCNTTVPDCPAGSFCSPGPASVCTLECDPDNRCQDGYYCSCDGMCVALGSISDGGAPPNSACPADAALLQSSSTLLRTCQWDDECPYGSRCDRGLGTCTWNCLDGVLPCAAGQVCNCLGQCIPAAQDGGIPQPASYAPRLGATPVEGLLILDGFPSDNPWGNDPLDPNLPATRTIEVELTTGTLTKLADGGEVGPSPTITVKPEANVQVKCIGVSAGFEAAGAPCSFSAWSYQRTDAGVGGSGLIRAVNTVVVRAAGQADTLQARKSWPVRVSGENVDGAPVDIIYYVPLPPSTPPSGSSAEVIEKSISQADYNPTNGSPFVGTMRIVTPTAGVLTIPVQAHISGDTLAIFDQTGLIAPNGILPLKKLEYPTDPNAPDPEAEFPADAFVRWVYADATPAYQWSMDASARIVSFRQLDGVSDAPVEAQGEIAFRVQVHGGSADIRFSLQLGKKDIGSCTLGATTLVACSGNEQCSYGFCAEGASGGPVIPGPAGAPRASVSTDLAKWIVADGYCERCARPSGLWCAHDASVGFQKPWNQSLFGMPAAKLLDGDLPCLAVSPDPEKPQTDWAGPYPFSHRQSLEKNGAFKSELSTSDLFSRCLAELKRPAPPKVFRGEEPAAFTDFAPGVLDYKADCVSLGVIGKVIGLRNHADFGYDAEFSGMTTRLAQEWFRLHGFLMHQGVEQFSEEDVVLRESTSSSTSKQPEVTPTPSPSELLTVMERGLAFAYDVMTSVVLRLDAMTGKPRWSHDYRTQARVQRCAKGENPEGLSDNTSACPSEMWRCQDSDEMQDDNDAGIVDCSDGTTDCPLSERYRHCVLDPDKIPQSDDIANSVEPVMLDSLTGYMRVVQADLEKALLDGYQEQSMGGLSGKAKAALARYGNAARLTAYFQAMAARMSADDFYYSVPGGCVTECTPPNGCVSNCIPPRWYDRYRKAARELDQQMERTANAALKLATNENPLGVGDDDTPIFFGDLQGTNSRYFASSDYLISTWANPAVASANAALSTARDAWIASRNASLTTQENENAHQRRLEDIATSAGKTILDNCGGLSAGSASVDSRSVVEALHSLGPEDAHTTLNRCFVGGGKYCTLQPQQFQIEDAITSRFKKNSGAAVSELCRLDYMRANYQQDWLGAVTVYAARTGIDHFRTRTDFDPFMASGEPEEGTFCDDCRAEPTCNRETCVENCWELCPSGNSTKCQATRGACWYRYNDCPKPFLFDNGKGCDTWRWRRRAYPPIGVPVTSPFPPYEFVADPDAKRYLDAYELCRELSKKEDYGELDELALRLCSKNLLDSDCEFAKSAAAYTLDCLARHADENENPKHVGGGRSIRWRNVKVGEDSNGVLKFYLGGAQVQPSDPQLPVSLLYAPGLTELRLSEGWKNADAVCGSEGFGSPLPSWELPRECLRGKLGVAWSQLHDIYSQAERDRATLFEKVGNWSSWLLACDQQDLLSGIGRSELSTYLAQREKLLSAAGSTEVMRTFVCGSVSGGMSGAGFGKGWGVVPGVMNGFLGGMFASEAERIRREMAVLDSAHARFREEMDAKIASIQCSTNNRIAYNAIGPVRAQIAQRLDEFQTAIQSFASLLEQNRLVYDTAAAQLDSEKLRKVADFSHHYWYSEKVDTFRKAMTWAKQLTYLALRAVEFEFQESLDLRGKVVAARHPKDLSDALLSLQQVQATRGVNRKRPEESSIVMSLRDDILEIEDHSKLTGGERNWTPAQRFKGRLWDERYTIRDENGQWIGQGVAFSIKEKGILENRCGERLWRVTATVQGDNLSPLEPGTPLTLLKKNTFYSQYCRGHGDGLNQQWNSIRPSNQLFTGKVSGMPDETTQYSAAALYPWFNVRRFDFYNADYQKGASEELAGRGLYGEYILLFPRQVLDKTGKNPFPLENVEDVLLRVDYLSVDDLSPVGSNSQAEPLSPLH